MPFFILKNRGIRLEGGLGWDFIEEDPEIRTFQLHDSLHMWAFVADFFSPRVCSLEMKNQR